MELLDVYNEEGKKTGKVVKRGSPKEAYEEGEHIAVAIIFIENSKHEFLIQKTSKEKGGEYSSTGGHVNHKEEPIQTIIREVKEESGLSIPANLFKDIGDEQYSNRYGICLGKNYMVVLGGTINDYKPGNGDGENDKFEWIPIDAIGCLDWAFNMDKRIYNIANTL